MTKRCCLYLRVSSEGQSFENQRPELLQLAKARGFEVVAVFEEKISAVKQRPAFDRMMLAAQQGKFDALLIWSLDRFGRSMAGNLAAVLELDRIGVQIVSVREQWLDTSGPVRSLLIAIASWVAEQERLRIGERTKAGLERARRQGKQIGRPRVHVDVARASMLRAQGQSMRAVAASLGVGLGSVHKALTAYEELVRNPVPTVREASRNGIAQAADSIDVSVAIEAHDRESSASSSNDQFPNEAA